MFYLESAFQNIVFKQIIILHLQDYRPFIFVSNIQMQSFWIYTWQLTFTIVYPILEVMSGSKWISGI